MLNKQFFIKLPIFSEKFMNIFHEYFDLFIFSGAFL